MVRRLYQDTKISKKFTISFAIIFFVPLLFLGLAIYYQLQNTIKNEVNSSFNHVITQYVENINYKLNIYINLLDTIAVSGTVQSIFSEQEKYEANDTIELSNKFSKEIDSVIIGKNPQEVYNLMLYAYNDSFPSDGRHIGNMGSLKYESWYKDITGVQDTIKYITYTVPGLNKGIISFMRPIADLNGVTLNNPNKKLGVIKLDINKDKLFEAGNFQIAQKEIEVYILDKRSNIIFANLSDKLSGLDIRKELASKDMIMEINTGSGQRKLLVQKNISQFGLTAVFVFSYDTLDKKVAEMGTTILIVFIILGFIMAGMAYAFSYLLSKRIALLLKKIKKVEKGDFKVTDVIEGKDEIGLIDNNFNRMVLKLDELIRENYIQQLEKRDAELNALQAQINPHFLYNTLELINSISRVYGCNEVCLISQNLGEMFRYGISIGRNEFVRLSDEINHISNYTSIQLLRFDELFEVSYEISDELMDCKLLKFILQPIVENAIIHGFKGKDGKGHLKISAFSDNKLLVLQVQDDGIGMGQELVEDMNNALNNNEYKPSKYEKKSIGIRNVSNRIKLAYGDEYGIHFDSMEGFGTRVTISLPYLSRGE
jgi:two-component system, sensor histidine kinase YesM